MDRIRKRLTLKFWQLGGALEKTLEHALDQDTWEQNPSEKLKKNHFEISTDLDLIKNISFSLPEKSDERIIILFSRLTSFFDSGVLLYRKQVSVSSESWVPGSAFQLGEYHPVLDGLLNKQLHLPSMASGELRKTAPYTLLAPLELTALCDETDACGFVIKPHDKFLILLFSKLPEPWLRRQIEVTHKLIAESMLEYYE
jgi:hypothetical protein